MTETIQKQNGAVKTTRRRHRISRTIPPATPGSRRRAKRIMAQMCLCDDSQKTISEFLKIGRPTISYKIQRSFFNQQEIMKLVKHWKLTPEQIYSLFFDEGAGEDKEE